MSATPLTLGQLIVKLSQIYKVHGDHPVYIETDIDEHDIYSVDWHHVHNDSSQPLVVCISAKQE